MLKPKPLLASDSRFVKRYIGDEVQLNTNFTKGFPFNKIHSALEYLKINNCLCKQSYKCKCCKDIEKAFPAIYKKKLKIFMLDEAPLIK